MYAAQDFLPSHLIIRTAIYNGLAVEQCCGANQNEASAELSSVAASPQYYAHSAPQEVGNTNPRPALPYYA